MLAPSRPLLRYLQRACRNQAHTRGRPNGGYCAVAFSTATRKPSGHSKWATIKHDKARADAKKNKQRSMLAQQIELMVRLYGPDTATNPRLKGSIADAKRQGLPKEVLDSALKRGQGLSTSGKPLESLTIEAMFPGNIAAIIECATESKAKTLMEVRTILTKNGGAQGVVGFLFQRRGVVRVRLEEGSGSSVDALLDCVGEVEGFEDFEENSDGEGAWNLICEPSAVKAVADAVEEAQGIEVLGMQILWHPLDVVEASDENSAVVEACLDKLEEMHDVREVYLNMRR